MKIFRIMTVLVCFGMLLSSPANHRAVGAAQAQSAKGSPTSEKSRLCAAIRSRADGAKYLDICKDAARFGDKEAAIFVGWHLLAQRQDSQRISNALEYIVPFLNWSVLTTKCITCNPPPHDDFANKYPPRNIENLFADAVINDDREVVKYLNEKKIRGSDRYNRSIVLEFAYNSYLHDEVESAIWMVLQGLIKIDKSFIPPSYDIQELIFVPVSRPGRSVYGNKPTSEKFYLYIEEDGSVGDCQSTLSVGIYPLAEDIEYKICDSVSFKDGAMDHTGKKIGSVVTMYVTIICQHREGFEDTQCESKPQRIVEGVDRNIFGPAN